jgi:hypothetical protein
MVYDVCVVIGCVCWNAGNETLGDEGAIRIAEGLEKNTSVKKICLDSVFCPIYFSLFSLFSLVKDELFIAHLCHQYWLT